MDRPGEVAVDQPDALEEIRVARRRAYERAAALWQEPVSRRRFLKLMAASAALAGLVACAPPREQIVPYVRPPQGVVPGRPLFFATALTLGGYATGLLVESHEGRPTKVEGNPDHPASRGATDAFAQASVLTLYDPDRSRTITYLGRASTWPAFLRALRTALDPIRATGGAGLRILTETVTSPTLAAQLQELLGRFPQAKWHQWEPVGRDNARAGARLAFGQDVEAHYRFDQAEVILALDADFLFWGPGRLRAAREFAARRRPEPREGAPDGLGPNRLYVVEPTPSITGTMADHRLPLRAAEVEPFARALAAALGVPGLTDRPPPTVPPDWFAALVTDLQRHRGRSLVVAGDWQPPAVHALAQALNQTLGNVGSTVVYTDPVAADPGDQPAGLRDLVADLNAGQVELLLILGGNPVYTAPADLDFGRAIEQARLRVHLGLYADETAARCQWHVPQAHELEAWSDARADDGTATIVQPLIAPLYDGKSAHELLAALSDQPERTGHDLVRSYWQSQRPGPDFDRFWRTALHRGLVDGTALAPKEVALTLDPAALAARPDGPEDAAGLELVFRPDPTVYDGRFANNAWLQELPKPLTKLTWDNAALLSPATAARFGVANGDLVELRFRGRSVLAPALVLPGPADEVVTVTLGYGRTRAGRVGNGTGFNAYQLRPADALWFGRGLELVRTGRSYPLAITQGHHQIEGRDLVRAATFVDYQRGAAPRPVDGPGTAGAPERAAGEAPSLYPGYEYPGYAWGMAIDLSACIGCNACVVACQAENNIPVVGKDQVLRGREMHWLRIDDYVALPAGGPESPRVYHQPVPCMQCENAPCELVCPVAATVHSSEGLNDMVYNRCIGTRYCSNNCPYKVRRFNFFQYADYETPSLKLLRNPDVTVRERGVMEKCTYCVQRIKDARVRAEREGRAIRDGEVLTACQAACPTDAIVFGNLNDPNSRVARLKAERRSYALLAELNTRPRTTYLAALHNPNPEIGGGTR